MRKESLINELKESLKMNWGGKKLPVMLKVQENIQLEDVDIKDMSFDVKNNTEYTEEYDQFIVHFDIKGEEVKVDYLFDVNEQFRNNDLFLHGLYKIAENENSGGDVFLYEEHNPRYQTGYELVRTLNFLSFKEIFDYYEDELYAAREEYQSQKDNEFYKKYNEFLSGVVAVSGTLNSRVTLELESGMKIRADKFDIESEAQTLARVKILKEEELIQTLKNITDHNLKQVNLNGGEVNESRNLFVIAKDEFTIYDFFVDETGINPINPLEYYDRKQLDRVVNEYSSK